MRWFIITLPAGLKGGIADRAAYYRFDGKKLEAVMRNPSEPNVCLWENTPPSSVEIYLNQQVAGGGWLELTEEPT